MDCRTTGRRDRLAVPLYHLVATCLLSSWAGSLFAQEPGQRSINGYEPRLHKLPERGARTPENLDEFVGRVSSTDAIVEIIVGQGKLLTFRKDLAPEGLTPPVVAVGDPTVIDFEVLDQRHIRVTAIRIGVSDLSILTAEGDDYAFEIQVTADMGILQARLDQTFPEANVRVRQVRDHVVIDGDAPDFATRKLIEDTVAAYLLSVQAQQLTKVKSRTGNNERDGPPRPSGDDEGDTDRGETEPDPNKPDIETTIPTPKIINLIRIERFRMNELDLQLQAQFPTALIEVEYLGNKVILRGQARDAYQKAKIYEVVEAYVQDLQAEQKRIDDANLPGRSAAGAVTNLHLNINSSVAGRIREVDIVDLMTVAGPQQVMLKVEVAELNRTAFRAIGLEFLANGNDVAIGTRLGPGSPPRTGSILDFILPASNVTSTVFGVFANADFRFVLDALRRNNVFKVLAEPNLVAMNGQEASFLAGGSFPVPVPQSGAGGGVPTITIVYKEFGVSLDFRPTILDEEEIQLAVATEVSSIDENLGLTLEGFNVPALNERRASTTVQMREGSTLAIAGLLQVELQGNTNRIPGLGDLAYVGPFFSNTTSETVEKELIVLITPYIVDSVDRHEIGPRPGDLVEEPTDFELYFLNRIERRACDPTYRATIAWDDPHHRDRYLRLESDHIFGPHGYSD